MGDRIYVWRENGTIVGPLDRAEAATIPPDPDQLELQITYQAVDTKALNLQKANAPLALSTTLVLPCFAFEQSLAAARFWRSSDQLIIEIFGVADRNYYETDFRPLNASDLNSHILRSTPDNAQALEESIREFLSAGNQALFAADTATATGLLLKQDSDESPGIEAWQQRFKKLLAFRSSYAKLMLATTATESSASATAASVREFISLLDGLNSIALIQQISALNDLTTQTQRTTDAQAIKAARRDRALSIAGAAILPPSLWFSFLGANIFPKDVFGVQVASTEALAISLVIACGLVALAAAALRINFHENTRTDDDD